ncbi:uncharacterized protein METZ01_LOCUS298585, partial [marine metagenome]
MVLMPIGLSELTCSFSAICIPICRKGFISLFSTLK